MQSLFFIGRHGETVLNDGGNYRGWSNGPDAQLNENGVKSAHEAGEFLVKLNRPFNRIICSPLDRSQHTAAIIAEYLGVTQLEIDDRLMPVDVGDLAGKSKKDNPVGQYLANKNLKFPGGESVAEFEVRQHNFASDLMDYLETPREGETLVEAHVSNIMYWWNALNNNHRDDYLDEQRDLVLPGGVAMVTGYATLPIFRDNLKTEPPIEENKIDQGAALYFDAASINRPAGARCGACWKYILTGGCVEVDGKIEAAKVCGLYVSGKPFVSDPKLPIVKVSQAEAGYGDGDTHCVGCEYFHGRDKCFKVRGYDGKDNLKHIEEHGCCGLFDPK